MKVILEYFLHIYYQWEREKKRKIKKMVRDENVFEYK
jgi:hypothetical protein